MVKTSSIKNKQSHRAILKAFFMILIVMLTSIPLISATIFDNTYSFDKNVGDHGKYEIRDWFGLLKLQDLELKTNTKECINDNCKAEIPINHYQNGILIEDIRFIDTKSNTKTKIRDYQLIVNEKEYNLGDEIVKGDYNLEILGKLKTFQTVDWQIKVNGKWLDKWAIWSSGLNTNLEAYYPFDVNTTDNSISGETTYDLVIYEGAPDLAGAGCLIGDCINFTTDKNLKFANDNLFDFYSASKTYNFWGYENSDNAGVYLLGSNNNEFTFRWRESTNEFEWVDLREGSKEVEITPIPIARWVMITLVNNNTHFKVYVNGTLKNESIRWSTRSTTEVAFGVNWGGTSEWEGRVDEMGVWSRDLSSSEISDLYNNGEGIAPGTGIVVTLNSPEDNDILYSSNINFTASLNQSSALTFKNATYFIWYNNGTIYNQTNITVPMISGNNNNTILQINFVTPETYKWNVLGCGETASATNCAFAEDNKSFDWRIFRTTDEDWTNNTIEGNTETFIINFTLNPGFTLNTVNFIYNKTSSIGGFVNIRDNNYTATKTITVPGVSSDTNLSWYWNLEVEGFESNSTEHNQTVQDIAMDNCTDNSYVLFNFTMFDEDSLAFLIGNLQNTTIKIDLDLKNSAGVLVTSFSESFVEENPVTVCMSIDIGENILRADSIIEYKADDKFIEFYNIQNFTIKNGTMYQNISLYNLNSSVGQEFKITYKDSNFNTVPGALIQIQRQYVDEGLFRTIEIPKISSAGYTIGHLIRSDVIYNLIILKEGVILDSFTNIVANCQTPALDECEININSLGATVSPTSFSTDGDFSSTLTYDEDTRIIQSIFLISSGVSAVTSLNVTLFDMLGNQTVCADSLFAAGGTLDCVVPTAFGNGTVVAKIWSGGSQRRSAILTLNPNPSDIYGSSLVFLALSVILLIIGISVTDNTMVLGVMLIFGTIIVAVLGMITFKSWVGAGATILWLVIAIIIIMIKGAKRS